MEVIARQKLGMSRAEFYSLTWYDWTLWIERIKELDNQRNQEKELLIEIARSSLAKYANWHGIPVEPDQIFGPLSYDKVRSPTDTEPSDEEKIRAIKEVAEKVKRRKRGG